ncbi:MAG: C2H2-type zinc finger protein [Oscillospiraceae bacterium]|nr:C2H2-type zinc finger protein [Oscillospiraceae bacterium]
MAYIANRPVRFGRDYKVGEVIPDEVIAPGMARKLAEMGRILRVDLPSGGGAEENHGQPQNDPQDGAESAIDGDSGAGEANQPEDESPQDSAESAAEGTEGEGGNLAADGEFVCTVCGRAFKSQNALAAHTRSHKE